MITAITSATAPVRLSATEKAPLVQQAKQLETRLIELGVDAFTKQHSKSREEEYLQGDTSFCNNGDGINFMFDRQFRTPAERFVYLLQGAQKYQQDSEYDKYATIEAGNFDASVKRRTKLVSDMENELKKAKDTLQHDIEHRDEIIKKNTEDIIQYKINFLENIFAESQKPFSGKKQVK